MTQDGKTAVPQRANCLLARLRELVAKQDRGALAALRRGLSPATAHYAWPLLASWGVDLTKDRERTIHQAVAGCYAEHPEEASAGNLGTTVHRIATDKGDGETGLKSFDARFRRLLICGNAEELSERIPPVIRAAKAKGVPVNYHRLFQDMWFWGDRSKLDWAQEFWGVDAAAELAATATDTAPATPGGGQ